MRKHVDHIESVLFFTYIAMAALCVYLNLFSGQKVDFTNILINVIMFLIIATILLKVRVSHFRPVNGVIRSLLKVSGDLNKEYDQKQTLLWESYTGRRDIFKNALLDERNARFIREYQRKYKISRRGFKCDIEDYINDGLIDTVMSKNMLNQVAGAMTGLGILGTFVGLSFGLQHFSTGTTQEITESIAPLMDGIKIAFHTSIYGMIFSLVFNYVYKRKLDEAYHAVDQFLSTFRECVLPEAADDNLSIMLEYQKLQADQIRLMQEYQRSSNEQFDELKTHLGADIADRMAMHTKPQMDQMGQTIEQFARVATRSQVEGIAMVANQFIDEMNRTLGGKLAQMSTVVDQAYSLQRQNGDQMTDMLNRIGNMTGSIDNINSMSANIVYGLSGYIQKIENLQDTINRTQNSANMRLDAGNQLMDQLQNYAGQLAEYQRVVNQQAQSGTSSDSLVYEIRELTQAVDALRETILGLEEGKR